MINLPKENIYGHSKRLEWIVSHIDKADTIIELGCGTGYMITLPLAEMGYNILGIDLDEESIRFGRKIFKDKGLSPDILHNVDIADLDTSTDTIIASEVLEHITTSQLTHVLFLIKKRLEPGGRFLVTVPNGFGLFEMEKYLWFDLGIGKLLTVLKLPQIITKIKEILVGPNIDFEYPSTLSDSPHVQRFTLKSILAVLNENDFEILDSTGSVLFAGPFSNLFFTGIKPVMKINCVLGKWFPRIAAGFYVACKTGCEPPYPGKYLAALHRKVSRLISYTLVCWAA